MPLDAATTPSDLHAFADTLESLAREAARFLPPDRAPALAQRMLGNGPADPDEDRLIAMIADATLLAVYLVLMQPSASGSTAFDRLARARTDVDKPMLQALQHARMRLLLAEAEAPDNMLVARDEITGEALLLSWIDHPPIEAGTPLFGLVAIWRDNQAAIIGPVTPLDSAAHHTAKAHPAARSRGSAAGARWAEAVATHVVRNGTLDIPGLNRPSNDFDPDRFDDDPLAEILPAWIALGGAAPDAELLADTREQTDASMIFAGLNAITLLERGSDAAHAVEAMLLVMLETVVRRERAGCSGLTLDGIAAALETEIAEYGAPPRLRTLFAGLRLRLPSSAGRPRDGEGERMVQRIQALRAKTVEQGCTEAEALAAAEKVAELLDRHGLSLSALDFRAQPCEGMGVQTTRRRAAPIDETVPAIAKFLGCRVWSERAERAPLRYVFFGLRGDIAAAGYLYDLIERTFETETDAFKTGRLYAKAASGRRTASNSFQVGLAHGICRKLAELRAARDAARSGTGRDLVIVKGGMVNAELDLLGLGLTSRPMGLGRKIRRDAYSEGTVAGARFEYAPGITAA